MKKDVWLNRLGLLSFFLTIITLVITLTINAYPLYVWDVSYLTILDWVDLSKKELLVNYRVLMAYLNLPWLSSLKLTDFPVSESGAFHFYEVKKLFMLNYSVLLLSSVPTYLYLKKLRKRKSVWQLVRPCQIGASLPLVIGFFMLTGFDKFFELFHGVFFNNDAWLFDPATDPIINVLPQDYFFHCFILAFVLLELTFLLAIYLGKRELRN